MKRSYSKVKEIVMKQILLAGELNEFKIDENLTVYADSLEQDMVVFDVDNNPYSNQEFTFEGKVYKTGDSGEIVSIEDVEAEDTADVESTDVQATEATTQDAPNAELEAANKRIDELEVENQALKAELETLKQEAVQLASQPQTQGINLSNISTEEVEKPKTTLGVIREVLSK
ncbi:hypothetical protein [Flavobacterium sp.]|uniref:hypothetical protein n=1 Tax=Flavobacterium sp. TaxID=239 RepID=UPI002FDD97ED